MILLVIINLIKILLVNFNSFLIFLLIFVILPIGVKYFYFLTTFFFFTGLFLGETGGWGVGCCVS